MSLELHLEDFVLEYFELLGAGQQAEGLVRELLDRYGYLVV